MSQCNENTNKIVDNLLDCSNNSLHQGINKRVKDSITLHFTDDTAPQMKAVNILPVIYRLIWILQGKYKYISLPAACTDAANFSQWQSSDSTEEAEMACWWEHRLLPMSPGRCKDKNFLAKLRAVTYTCTTLKISERSLKGTPLYQKDALNCWKNILIPNFKGPKQHLLVTKLGKD